MTDKEILREAIDKASGNGFLDSYLEKHEWYIHATDGKDSYILCIPNHATKTKIHMADFSVIFSHDFAKSFWNVDEPCDDCKYAPKLNCPDCLDWRSHLQTMVLEKNPIKYLETFL